MKCSFKNLVQQAEGEPRRTWPWTSVQASIMLRLLISLLLTSWYEVWGGGFLEHSTVCLWRLTVFLKSKWHLPHESLSFSHHTSSFFFLWYTHTPQALTMLSWWSQSWGCVSCQEEISEGPSPLQRAPAQFSQRKLETLSSGPWGVQAKNRANADRTAYPLILKVKS